MKVVHHKRSTSLAIVHTDNGYRFAGWSEMPQEVKTLTTLEVYSDLSITANFERIKHTLAVVAEGSDKSVRP